jgi:di/tricarboxylate transporter
LDRKALLKVDYGLLLTFAAFFVFSGNMSQITFVQDFFGGLMQKSGLLVSTLSCQVISNVPSAILLSQFTESYKPLLLGVNIGGVGTLISSLASLITFREYVSHDPSGTKKYLLLFSAFNFSFLLILLGACALLLYAL